MNGSKNILIVGGGIGGLTLAVAFRRRGIIPNIVERTPRFQAAGAGLGLGINAMNVLHQLGLGEHIEAAGLVMPQAVIMDEQGRVLQTLDFTELARHYGNAVAIHRAALQDALLAQVEPGSIRLGTTVRSLRAHADAVEVELSDGSTEMYDVVVGADGVHSAVRSLVFADSHPRYAGYKSWRFLVPCTVDVPYPIEMWGRGKRVGLVPLGGELLYGFTTLDAPQEAAEPLENQVERFREDYQAFGWVIPDVLGQIEHSDQLIHTDIEEVVLSHWVSGRVVLLGDAAHAMTPNSGQGAGMAIEDAFILAALLADQVSVDEALRAYEAQRMPRVRRVQDQARQLGWIGQWSSPLACMLRNRLLRALPDRFALSSLASLLTAEKAVRIQWNDDLHS